MSHHSWNYQQALRDAGFRVTRQRELIMDVVCQSKARLTAAELCEAVQQASPDINTATVYRSLAFLTEQNLVRIVMKGGTKHYVLGGPRTHHHLACRVCGREIEIPHDESDAFFGGLEQAYGFAIDEPHLILAGFCEGCRKTP